MKFEYTWNTNWIQEYESPWGILEKFRYANAIDGNTILELIGNESVKHLKNISNAGSGHRNLIYFSSIDQEQSQKLIGINLKEYHDNLTEKLIRIIPNIRYVGNYFHSNLSYCPICLNKGYHSILHQIRFFNYCAFHQEQELIDRCLHCNKSMPEYIINKGSNKAFQCSCGYCFLDSENIRSIFSSWKIQAKIQYKLTDSWINLPRKKIHRYHVIYPFDNYKKYFELDNQKKDYLTLIPRMMNSAFNTDISDDCEGIIRFSSHKGIFQIKNNEQFLNKQYVDAFSHRFTYFDFKERDRIDSTFFEIYKQTRIIYKSITRYILRKVIKKHSKCVKIFNKANQNGDVCPHALAFILWKMECEGKNSFFEIETHIRISKTYNFECIKERFSIFPLGSFMTYLEELLNPINRDEEFNFLDCNISSMNYIINRITAHLLIERYIKWLEVIQYPKKFVSVYPDDNIPVFLLKIPVNMSEEINFYFPIGRIDYMRSIIKEINNKNNCPFKSSTHYPQYRSPMRIAIDRMEK